MFTSFAHHLSTTFVFFYRHGTHRTTFNVIATERYS